MRNRRFEVIAGAVLIVAGIAIGLLSSQIGAGLAAGGGALILSAIFLKRRQDSPPEGGGGLRLVLSAMFFKRRQDDTDTPQRGVGQGSG